MVGCPLKQLKEHLEHNFQDGMTWDNYGREGWHIDHKIPCAAFNLSNPSEQKKCFHYTNLTPKWANENRKKSDKLADGTLARHLPLLPFNTPASN